MRCSTASPENRKVHRPVDQMLSVPNLEAYGIRHGLVFYARAVIVRIVHRTRRAARTSPTRSRRPMRQRFGIPLILCLREVHNFDQLMQLGYARMDNSVTQEDTAALIEIAKIGNHRLEDLVADAHPIATARTRRLDRVATSEGAA